MYRELKNAVTRLQAKAWDEGHEAGYEAARQELDDSCPALSRLVPRLNPYEMPAFELELGGIKAKARRLQAEAWTEGYDAGYGTARKKLSDSPFGGLHVRSSRNPYSGFGV